MFPIWTIAIKDLRILKADKMALFWVFGFPLLMALFFGSVFAGGGAQAGALELIILDADQSEVSKNWSAQVAKSKAIKVNIKKTWTESTAVKALKRGKVTAIAMIPKGFSQNQLFVPGSSENYIRVVVDPSRSAERGFLEGILTQATVTQLQSQMQKPEVMKPRLKQLMSSVDQWPDASAERTQNFRNFFREYTKLLDDQQATASKEDNTEVSKNSGPSLTPSLNLPLKIQSIDAAQSKLQSQDSKQPNAQTQASVNPTSPYEISFPSAILWAMLGAVSSFSISIVRERKNGTLTRLRVAPISRTQIIAGKALACFLCCVFVTVALTCVGVLGFRVKIQSLLAFIVAVVSMSSCFVGLTMFVSCLGETEEAVSNAGWGIMIPFAMIGGGMVPLFFMPAWMRQLSVVSPVKWGILALEGSIWRNFSLFDMLTPCGILIAMGLVTFYAGVRGLKRLER